MRLLSVKCCLNQTFQCEMTLNGFFVVRANVWVCGEFSTVTEAFKAAFTHPMCTIICFEMSLCGCVVGIRKLSECLCVRNIFQNKIHFYRKEYRVILCFVVVLQPHLKTVEVIAFI